MAHKTKPAAQARPFTDRAQHYAAIHQGISNLKRDHAGAEATVRALLEAAVRAGAES